MIQLSTFWQASLYTGAAILSVAVSAWWLYFSPMKAAPGKAVPVPPKLAWWLVGLLGFAAFQLTAGALWDGSMHIRTGEIPAGADFLWPPHIMIYSSFLLSFIVALIAIGVVALPGFRAGERDPRKWVRRSPYLGAVALASIYSMFSIPGDALWHELFGIDLTAWSPPHVLIAAMMATVMISAVGLLAQARRSMAAPRRADVAIMGLLGLMLNVIYIIGVVEWEYSAGQSHLVESNPIWMYPLVGGALAFLTLILAKRLANFRFAATATAAAFYTVRLTVMAGMGVTGNIVPSTPLLFLLGALLLDMIPWQRISSRTLRGALTALAYTAGYAVLALPVLALRGGYIHLTLPDYFYAVGMTLLVSLALVPVAREAGKRLSLIPDPVSDRLAGRGE